MESFEAWINSELEKRGWSQSEAARRSGISASMFSQVISGIANPGPDFLIGVAHAFGLTRREIFARAGMIEPDPDPNEPDNAAMLAEFERLPKDERVCLLKIARALNAYRKTRTNPKP